MGSLQGSGSSISAVGAQLHLLVEKLGCWPLCSSFPTHQAQSALSPKRSLLFWWLQDQPVGLLDSQRL